MRFGEVCALAFVGMMAAAMDAAITSAVALDGDAGEVGEAEAGGRGKGGKGGKGDKGDDGEEGHKGDKVGEHGFGPPEEEEEPPKSIVASRAPQEIVVDGILNEGAWAQAEASGGFFQAEPEESDEPAARTEIRVLFDDDNLYVGISSFGEPGSITAREMQHDTKLDSDDHVTLVLDSLNSRRNAYKFRVNPLGARSDGLVEGNTDLGQGWNGIWLAKATMDDANWTAEVAIPFKTVNFNPDDTSWGFNVERVIKRQAVVLRWVRTKGGGGINNVAGAGRIENLVGVKRGIGLDVIPQPSVYYGDENNERWDVYPSVDATYKLNNYTNVALTYETAPPKIDPKEFVSDVERQGGLIAERREFFTQESGIFEFGGIKKNGRPFYSRRIGYVGQGDKEDYVAPLGGARITGSYENIRYGLLNMQTQDGDSELSDSANVTVARGTIDVHKTTQLGVIMTHGDPTCDRDTSVVGADAQYYSDELFEDSVLMIDGWVASSFGDEVELGDKNCRREFISDPDDTLAYGARVEFSNDEFETVFTGRRLGDGYDPALGMIELYGVYEYDVEAKRKFRRPGKFIRQLEFGGSVESAADIESHSFEKIESKIDIVKATTRDDDFVRLYYQYDHQYLAALPDFEEPGKFKDPRLHGIIVLKEGGYDGHGLGVMLGAAEWRQLSGELDVLVGSYFTGTRVKINNKLTWRPDPHFLVSSLIEHVWLQAEDHSFTETIASAYATYFFTPDLSVSVWGQFFDQFDEEEPNKVGFGGLFSWTIEPGREFTAMAGLSYRIERGPFEEVVEPVLNEGYFGSQLKWTVRF